MPDSSPHSEPCPVCLRDDAWELEYDFGTGDEVEVIRCQNCQWPPTTPHTVEEWRRRHFISPYLKDLEAMVADRDERIRSLEEQLHAVEKQRDACMAAAAATPPPPAIVDAVTSSLLEQLEAARRDLVDAVWDGQRQGFQAVREAISGRIAAPLVDEIMENAEIIVRESNPAISREAGSQERDLGLGPISPPASDPASAPDAPKDGSDA